MPAFPRTNHSGTHSVRAFVYIVFEMLKHESIRHCHNGHWQWPHVGQFQYREPEKVFACVAQHTLPLRLVRVITVDVPWPMRIITKILWPFISAKVKTRLMMIDKLQVANILPAHCLPVDFDGQYVFDSAAWLASATPSELSWLRIGFACSGTSRARCGVLLVFVFSITLYWKLEKCVCVCVCVCVCGCVFHFW